MTTPRYRLKEFSKMHGAGNDFVVFETKDIIPLKGENIDFKYIATKLSHRKLGVGCDQLIIVNSKHQSEKTHYEMLVYNADGSEASMCGNGIRCFSKYILDNKIANCIDGKVVTDEQLVHTKAGIIKTYIPQITDNVSLEKLQNSTSIQIKVDMSYAYVLSTTDSNSGSSGSGSNNSGSASASSASGYGSGSSSGSGSNYGNGSGSSSIGSGSSSGSTTQTNQTTDKEILVSGQTPVEKYQVSIDYPQTGKKLNCILVSMGNPHCVLFFDINQETLNANEFYEMDISTIAKYLQQHSLFKSGCNVEFVLKKSDNHFLSRVYENGSGETLACGTGACGVAVACILQGYATTDKPVKIEMPGGILTIQWDGKNSVFKTGPATTVFTSCIDI
ncbi:hypothetical protein DLAC_11075 [Tieghemostelium lacteum]|uniref:diaminopimelate epimerase n=1 Tax=Tieghemostelium lacteum TaxID=361077 RepID=A0A151Z377_TIELA|nr:hypothetical protein DLAC_11075 [Tieghemostelium lacteum]|eukprot:KYQ88377.1 hypothetical protein DLAC_11075 [Tieghemostelium lacteum]